MKPDGMRDAMREVFADAYAQAARADADMRVATTALESIRESIWSGQSYHQVLGAISAEIGQADSQRLVPALCSVREAYQKRVVEDESQRLGELFVRDPAAGWQAWLETYAGCFQEHDWNLELGYAIASEVDLLSPIPAWPAERIRRACWLLRRRFFAEGYDWILFLAEQHLPSEIHARLYAVAASIQLHHFVQPTGADRLLQRATEHASHELETRRVSGDLAINRGDLEEARGIFKRIVERQPNLPDGYLGLAECAVLEGNDVAAESFSQQAVRAAPGSSSAYSNLLKRRIDEPESVVTPLLERLVAVSGEDAMSRLTLGGLYRERGRFDLARSWATSALSGEFAVNAEIELGHLELAEADAAGEAAAGAHVDRAEAHFRRALETCPESAECHWSLAHVEVRRQDWNAAEAWCDRAMSCHAEWESALLPLRAEVRMGREALAAAEADLLRSLELEPKNPSALSTLYELAEKLDGAGDRATAERVLTAWRLHKGEGSEHLYQNQLGNWQYSAEDYAAAVACYDRAVQAKPDDPIIRSNRALAAEKLWLEARDPSWLELATDDLTWALRTGGDDPSYAERLMRLSAERDFVVTCGTASLELEPVVTPLRIEVAPDLLPAILDDSLSELSDATQQRVEEWRSEFKARTGVQLPGIRFSTLDGALDPDSFRVWVMERDTAWGTAANPPLEAMLALLEVECVHDMHEWIGHQETAHLLSTATDAAAAQIREQPDALTGLVAVLRRPPAAGVPIHDIDRLAADYLPRHRAGDTPERIAEQLATRTSAAVS